MPAMQKCSQLFSQLLPIIRFIRKPIVLFFIVLGGALSLANNLREVLPVIESLLPDKFKEIPYFNQGITLTLSHTDPVAAGTVLTLHYDLPNHGYYSLWNQNGLSGVRRFHPKTGKGHMMALNKTNRTGERTLLAKDSHIIETVIVLWTEKELPNPPQSQYTLIKQFENYLDANKRFDIKKEQVSIQVQ